MDEQASELVVPRNDYQERGLDTCVGTATLRIPKLRKGSYFPNDVVRPGDGGGLRPVGRQEGRRPGQSRLGELPVLPGLPPRTQEARPLVGVRLVTSDAHKGLARAVRKTLPGAA